VAGHTPTPWQVDPRSFAISGTDEQGEYMHVADLRGWGRLTGKGHGALGLSDADAVEVLQANAAFIVKAVNNHDALVAALIKAKTCLLDGCLPWVRHNGPREGTTHGRIDETVAAIDAALQEAGR
jgi:hypothetical protein